MGTWIIVVVAVKVALFLFWGIRWIPNDRAGIVEKTMALGGSITQGLIARSGEAGYQPRVLRGGLHWLMPIQYRVHRVPLVTIPQGRLGYVFARDGAPLSPEQALARAVGTVELDDASRFLREGGQRGPQRFVLREGTYAVNVAQFVVLTAERVHLLPLDKSDGPTFERMRQLIGERHGFSPVVLSGADDLVGVVTVHDGPSLPQGEIIAPSAGATHDNYQDPEAFLRAGGARGRQYDVLTEGTYFINRLFATVELIPKIVVEVGYVGVVVSYTGSRGTDLTGSEYKHGELVHTGERGVWAEGLLPGKYAFNTYAGRVVAVPTTNFILKWDRAEIGQHGFDENLAEVSLVTRDAFQPSLPLSVVVHIDYRKAPLVVQRFGDVKKLVEQTLDPMVAAYFKNVAQTRTLIQLLQERADIQSQASGEMRGKFSHYNLELEEVLIGTPTSDDGHTDRILEQLRDRQIAEERMATYQMKERAAQKERALREAEALAEQQKRLTESELEIAIRTNAGRADAERAKQEADQIRTLAEARADETRRFAEADAERAARVGIAQAVAIEEQVRAYGGPRFQVAREVVDRFAKAIEESRVDIVPRIVMNGGGSSGEHGGTNMLEALLAITLSDRLIEDEPPKGEPSEPSAPRPARAQAIRDELRGLVVR